MALIGYTDITWDINPRAVYAGLVTIKAASRSQLDRCVGPPLRISSIPLDELHMLIMHAPRRVAHPTAARRDVDQIPLD